MSMRRAVSTLGSSILCIVAAGLLFAGCQFGHTQANCSKAVVTMTVESGEGLEHFAERVVDNKGASLADIAYVVQTMNSLEPGAVTQPGESLEAPKSCDG